MSPKCTLPFISAKYVMTNNNGLENQGQDHETSLRKIINKKDKDKSTN